MIVTRPLDHKMLGGQIECSQLSQLSQEDQDRAKDPPPSGAIVPIQVDCEIPGCASSPEGSAAPSHAHHVSCHAGEISQPDVFVAVELDNDGCGRYSNEVQQTPLTTLDSSSNVGDTQELALLAEIGNQLAMHSPVVHQSASHPLPEEVISQFAVSPKASLQEMDGRLNKD